MKTLTQLVGDALQRARTYRGISTRSSITFHETANRSRGADAAAHARLQARGNSRRASWNRQTDDEVSIMSFPNTARTWHAGWFARNSISQEVCVNVDGDLREAWENAIEVGRQIRREEGSRVKSVKRHYDWTRKHCPHLLMSGQVPGLSWSKVRNRVMGPLDVDDDKEPQPKSPRKTKPRYPGTLRKGDRGDLVELWQDILLADGYDLGHWGADGVSGGVTVRATKQWQRDRGLLDDGVVGPATWTRALMSDDDGRLRKGDRGPHVELWQLIIRAKRDRVFGPKTKRKGKRVQRFLGVEPDSIPGPDTVEALVDYWT